MLHLLFLSHSIIIELKWSGNFLPYADYNFKVTPNMIFINLDWFRSVVICWGCYHKMWAKTAAAIIHCALVAVKPLHFHEGVGRDRTGIQAQSCECECAQM